MTQKERFINTLRFKGVDRVPFMEIALWEQTRERWEQEGMPPGIETGLMKGNAYFKLEGYDAADINATLPYPPLESEVIEENDEHVLFTDGLGRKRLARKSGTVRGQRMSMDQYIDFAVKDRKSFSEMKKRYEGNYDKRFPADWDSIVKRLTNADRPLTLLDPLAGTFGYYSMLRNWMGTEKLSYLLYDDPELIHECLEFLTDFIINLLEKAVKDVKFDFYFIHEDMCYKTGPLVSPELFRKFFLPVYKRFIEFLKSSGIEIILVDTDGNFEALIPLFLDAGVDGFGPMEVAAGMDPLKVRQKYGRSVCMIGGIDKREIAKGKQTIEEEINRTIVPLISQGGYIPTIDHSIPPDVSFDNFLYYLDLKRKVIFGER